MVKKTGISARQGGRTKRSSKEGSGPAHVVRGALNQRQATRNSFEQADLSAWGIEPGEDEPKLVRVAISERHHSLVGAVAQRRRMTNRAVLERVLEKFFENGEFARLMETPD